MNATDILINQPFTARGWMVTDVTFHGHGNAAVILATKVDPEAATEHSLRTKFVTALMTDQSLAHAEWVLGHYFLDHAKALADYDERAGKHDGVRCERRDLARFDLRDVPAR